VAIERLRFDEQPERLPPHNLEAEEAVLGSVLLDREVIGRVSGVLEARDFYRERNGQIYSAMIELYDRHEPVDYLTLIDELDRTQRLDQAGGTTYVAGLLGAVPTPIHAEHYAKIVADSAFMRRLISAGGKIATIGFQNQFDTETALEKSEQILFDISSKKANRDFAVLGDILQEYLEQLGQLREGEGVKYGVPSGYADLDKITAGGFQRSDLIILAARPAMGKTSLAMGIAANAALKFKAASAIFSLEMSGAQLAARLLSTESGIETTRLRSGNLTDAESRKLGHALGILAEAPIYVDDTPGISVTNLRAKARRLHMEVPLDLVIVDHLQLMTAGEGSGMNRVNEMSEISRQLKGLARELNVPVIALSQLSRAVEQRSPKIPILSDLRESGSIEQDADLVMFIYRDDYYNKDSEKQGIAEVHIAKHRNGPTGQISLLFNQKTTKFLDLEVYRD
jgi:replicative DNA helicase